MRSFELDHDVLYLPYEGKVVSAKALVSGEKIKFQSVKGGILLEVGELGEDNIDFVVELHTK